MSAVGPGNPPEEYRWKPGQSGNPKGENGYTKARKRVAEALEGSVDELAAALIRAARTGDTAALKFALGPFVPAQKAQVAHEHTGEVTFRWADDNSESEDSES